MELLRYPSFKEMFNNNSPELFGGESREFLHDEIKQFYSDEEEQTYGVVGVRFERIDQTAQNHSPRSILT